MDDMGDDMEADMDDDMDDDMEADLFDIVASYAVNEWANEQPLLDLWHLHRGEDSGIEFLITDMSWDMTVKGVREILNKEVGLRYDYFNSAMASLSGLPLDRLHGHIGVNEIDIAWRMHPEDVDLAAEQVRLGRQALRDATADQLAGMTPNDKLLLQKGVSARPETVQIWVRMEQAHRVEAAGLAAALDALTLDQLHNITRDERLRHIEAAKITSGYFDFLIQEQLRSRANQARRDRMDEEGRQWVRLDDYEEQLDEAARYDAALAEPLRKSVAKWKPDYKEEIWTAIEKLPYRNVLSRAIWRCDMMQDYLIGNQKTRKNVLREMVKILTAMENVMDSSMKQAKASGEPQEAPQLIKDITGGAAAMLGDCDDNVADGFQQWRRKVGDHLIGDLQDSPAKLLDHFAESFRVDVMENVLNLAVCRLPENGDPVELRQALAERMGKMLNMKTTPECTGFGNLSGMPEQDVDELAEAAVAICVALEDGNAELADEKYASLMAKATEAGFTGSESPSETFEEYLLAQDAWRKHLGKNYFLRESAEQTVSNLSSALDALKEEDLNFDSEYQRLEAARGVAIHARDNVENEMIPVLTKHYLAARKMVEQLPGMSARNEDGEKQYQIELAGFKLHPRSSVNVKELSEDGKICLLESPGKENAFTFIESKKLVAAMTGVEDETRLSGIRPDDYLFKDQRFRFERLSAAPEKLKIMFLGARRNLSPDGGLKDLVKHRQR